MPGKVSRKSGAAKGRPAGVKAKSQSSRCDLIFPVGRCHRFIKQGRYSNSTGVGGAIFMAAVLEYLTSELLELAGEMCLESKKKTITPRHIQLAIRNDEELNKIMCETMIASGGVLPNIQEGLFRRHDKKKEASATQEM